MLEQAVQNTFWNAAQSLQIAAMEWQRPFALLKPRVFPDGNAWCALYGEDLQQGVAGFGDTPAAAAADFDLQWSTQKAGPAAGATGAPAPQMICPRCKVDRFKEACPRGSGGNCPMVATTYGVPGTPTGWKLVPVELTQAMRAAWDTAPNGENDDENMRAGYRAMLAAAPPPAGVAVPALPSADAVLSEVVKWALAGHIGEMGVTVEAGIAIRALAAGRKGPDHG